MTSKHTHSVPISQFISSPYGSAHLQKGWWIANFRRDSNLAVLTRNLDFCLHRIADLGNSSLWTCSSPISAWFPITSDLIYRVFHHSALEFCYTFPHLQHDLPVSTQASHSSQALPLPPQWPLWLRFFHSHALLSNNKLQKSNIALSCLKSLNSFSTQNQ